MSQLDWDRPIDDLVSRIRNQISALGNKLPHSILNFILRLSPGFKVFLLILLGFLLYEYPNKPYAELYGTQYIAIFACVVIYGKRAAIGLLLLLIFLKVVLLAEVTFNEITNIGVPLSRFFNN